jgi:hypothetical protein
MKSMTNVSLLFYACLCLCIGTVCSSIRIRIVNAPFIEYLPSAKLHHIVVVSEDEQNVPYYSVDFSPVGNTFPRTPLRLLLGQSVPAEIRICVFDKELTNDEIVNTVFSNTCVKENMLQKMKQNSPEIYEYIQRVHDWECRMNLYTHNCQHFSVFARKCQALEIHKGTSKV